ncbi:branched-chain amino acid ABC transporter substrate-binding protein [Simplicispira hankyongi]|uniref:Branched-chain amino acid ABC transporter substrate-binding protein n=1 Tax=Simplicispira hankyongi TaxID=2315688 RepID=A0A398CFE2_9BURK|nr:branched-chain amino acid ABC transporter substrate-binding protein [Simplicispira hankyongi]RID99657.1 branched-chain amino acid ABC transporter substrate-binding protein [Simplicispira hankyongi]
MTQDLNRRQFSAGLVLTPFAAGGLLAGCSRIPDTVRIGVAQPLSGPIAALGQDLLNGVTLAVKELNAAGFNVDGKQVTLEVVSVDDKSDVETGKKVAQQLVDAGVVAVIGHLNSGVSIPTAPIYAAHGIAQIAISTNPKYTELGFPTTLRMVANDNLQAAAIASFSAEQLGGKRYAAVDDGTPYGKDLANGAAKRLEAAKKSVALRQSFDDKTVAFDELAAKLKAENIDVIISALNDFQVLALLQALKKINYTSVRLLGSDTAKTTDMIKGDGIIDGLYATSPVLEAKEFTAGPQFLEKYGAAFGKPPAYGGHYSYDSMYVLSQALQLAKSAKPEDITAALHKINGYAPVTGTMKWDEKGEQRYAAVGVYQLRRGNWELRMRSDRW